MALLLDRKTIAKLGSSMNQSGASKPSSIAMKLMNKMGWKEGQGLGKEETGIASHIVINKRDDNVGLGLESAIEADAVHEAWWHSAYAGNLDRFKKKMKEKKSKSDKKDKKKSKKDKRISCKESTDGNVKSDKKRKRATESLNEPLKIPSYDELFAATGGARLGMRARKEQKGKILRTEKSGVVNTAVNIATNIALNTA